MLRMQRICDGFRRRVRRWMALRRMARLCRLERILVQRIMESSSAKERLDLADALDRKWRNAPP